MIANLARAGYRLFVSRRKLLCVAIYLRIARRFTLPRGSGAK